jgi:hypothetical protein
MLPWARNISRTNVPAHTAAEIHPADRQDASEGRELATTYPTNRQRTALPNEITSTPSMGRKTNR